MISAFYLKTFTLNAKLHLQSDESILFQGLRLDIVRHLDSSTFRDSAKNYVIFQLQEHHKINSILLRGISNQG